MVMNWYRNIDRNKVQFDFMVFENGEKPDYENEIRRLGGKIYYMPYPGLTSISKCALYFDDFFKCHKEYKIVHGHVPNLAFLYLKIAKKYGVLFRIIHSHSIKGSDILHKRIRNFFLQHRIAEYANIYLACSKDAADYLYKNGEARNKAIIVNNGIDLSKFVFKKNIRNETRKLFNIQDYFIIGHIGRFAKEKNPFYLLKIFAEVKKKIGKTKLLLIGDGPLKFKIQKSIKKLNLEDDVILAGARKDVNNLLQAMDVFVFPSRFEGLGIALIEAQASALRCFASDRIPVEAKVSDLVQFSNIKQKPERWAESIIDFSNGYERETLLTKELSGYNILDIASRIENFYLKLGQ